MHAELFLREKLKYSFWTAVKDCFLFKKFHPLPTPQPHPLYIMNSTEDTFEIQNLSLAHFKKLSQIFILVC